MGGGITMTDGNERMTTAEFQARYGGQSSYRKYIGRVQTLEQAVYEMPRFRVESDFQWWLRKTAMGLGWEYYHPGDGKRQDPGFPDTWLLRPPYECIAELKMSGEKPQTDQIRWLTKLAQVREDSQTLSVCLWYPEHEKAILAYLEQPDLNNPPGIWEPGKER